MIDRTPKYYAKIFISIIVLLLTFTVQASSPQTLASCNSYSSCKPLAEKGNASAQNSLGAFYLRGEGVQQNYQNAALWYRKAANQGYVLAQSNLGGMYAVGKGVEKNYQEAKNWFRKAAEQGDLYSQLALGSFANEDMGVSGPKDIIEGYAWTKIAITELVKHPEYERKTYDAVVLLKLLEQKMSARQITQANKLVHEYNVKYIKNAQ